MREINVGEIAGIRGKTDGNLDSIEDPFVEDQSNRRTRRGKSLQQDVRMIAWKVTQRINFKQEKVHAIIRIHRVGAVLTEINISSAKECELLQPIFGFQILKAEKILAAN